MSRKQEAPCPGHLPAPLTIGRTINVWRRATGDSQRTAECAGAAARHRALEPARHPQHDPERGPQPDHHLPDAGVGQHRQPGVIGQVTGFDRRFITFALVLLGMVLMVGALTQVRLHNAAFEDLAHVIGMNRLRAAYLHLDPGIERYLVTSAHDDDNGICQTYNHLIGPNAIWQRFASSTAFIMFVNAGLSGVFAAFVAAAFAAPGPVVGTVGVACGLAFLGSSAALDVLQRVSA